MQVKSLVSVAVCGAMLACASSSQTKSARLSPEHINFAGTYQIAVCQTLPCSPSDSTGALAWGTLVLFDDTISEPVPVRSDFIGSPNGCFRLRRGTRSKSQAGLDPVGTTHWETDSAYMELLESEAPPGWTKSERDKNRIHLPLYRSPDAGDEVSAKLVGDTLRGTGNTGSSLVDSLGNSLDYSEFVYAARIGPPSVARCWK